MQGYGAPFLAAGGGLEQERIRGAESMYTTLAASLRRNKRRPWP